MIGKAKSCIGGFSLFNYVFDDEKGMELLRNNLCGETPVELFQEMKILQNLNQKATNKLISLVLSPHVNDGKNLSKKDLENITSEFLKELEIDVEKSQFIAFLHTEKLYIIYSIGLKSKWEIIPGSSYWEKSAMVCSQNCRKKWIDFRETN